MDIPYYLIYKSNHIIRKDSKLAYAECDLVISYLFYINKLRLTN